MSPVWGTCVHVRNAIRSMHQDRGKCRRLHITALFLATGGSYLLKKDKSM